MRKSFIFLIKTDSGPEGFKLLCKPKALSSRSKMDDLETSQLLFKYSVTEKNVFSFVLSIFQKSFSAKVGILLQKLIFVKSHRNGVHSHKMKTVLIIIFYKKVF